MLLSYESRVVSHFESVCSFILFVSFSPPSVLAHSLLLFNAKWALRNNVESELMSGLLLLTEEVPADGATVCGIKLGPEFFHCLFLQVGCPHD